jgi:hypothetical protein
LPITSFNSFTDGLDPNRRSREHFVTNIDLEDQRRWVPYADGVWLQPCQFNVTAGGFSVVLKGLPGAMLGTHYHVGTVRGYTGWIVRLFGFSGENQKVALTCSDGTPIKVWRTDFREQQLERLGTQVDVPAWELVSLRIEVMSN